MTFQFVVNQQSIGRQPDTALPRPVHVPVPSAGFDGLSCATGTAWRNELRPDFRTVGPFDAMPIAPAHLVGHNPRRCLPYLLLPRFLGV